MEFLRRNRYEFLLFLTGFLLGFKLIVDTDLWWHLAAGRWIWENQSPSGSPGTSITWGYELLIYLVSSSMTVLIAAHALAAALALLLAWKTFRLVSPRAESESESLAIIPFALSAWVIQFRWINRPEVFTHLIGSAFLFFLVKDSKSRSARNPWVIPALQIIWVNLHGLFAFGPTLVALFLGADLLARGGRAKVLARTLALTLFACLLNPRGWVGAVFLTNSYYQRAIPEGGSPFHEVTWGWDAWGLIVYAAVTVTAFLGWLRFRKDSRIFESGSGWVFAALFLILMWASITARRNISLLALWTVPWVAALISDITAAKKPPASEAHVLGVGVLLLLMAGAVTNLLYPAESGLRFGGGLLPHRHPEGAARFIQEKKIAGPFFADVACSNYLLYHVSSYQPYIDGRLAELYSESHFKHYMDILAHSRLFDEEARARDLRTVVLCHESLMVKSLVHFISRSPGWKTVYFDEVAVVFVRDENLASLGLHDSLAQAKLDVARRLEAEQSWVDDLFQEKLNLRYSSGDRVKPFVQLADVASMLGDLDFSKHALHKAVSISERHGPAWTSLCRVNYLAIAQGAEKNGKVDPEAVESGEQICRKSLELGGDKVSANQILGLLLLNTGRPRPAIAHFARVVAESPSSYEGHFMMARAYQSLGDPDSRRQAILRYTKASALRPFEPLPLVEIGGILEAEKRANEALLFFERAYVLDARPEIKKKIDELRPKS